MFKSIKNLILGKNYDPNQKTGQFGGTGIHIDDQKIESEPNKYEANAEVLNVHPDGGINVDRNAKTTMKDVQDYFTGVTQELLGNPQTIRPSKNRFESVDAQLAAQYYGNMK